MTFYMSDRTRKGYQAALRDAGSAAAAVKVAGQFAGLSLDDSLAELIALAALGHADDRLGISAAVDREAWAISGRREYERQRMRRQLLEAVAEHGHVPIALPAETIHYLKTGPPLFGAEVPEDGDWDTVQLVLEVDVRTPPVNRADAVKAGLLTGADPAAPSA